MVKYPYRKKQEKWYKLHWFISLAHKIKFPRSKAANNVGLKCWIERLLIMARPEFVNGQQKMLEVEHTALKYVVCAVDIGTTNFKTEFWVFDTQTKQFRPIEIEIEWGDYFPQVEKIAGQEVKFINPKQIKLLLEQISNNIEQALGPQKITSEQKIVFAFTGFHHDLVVTHNGRSFMIGDDPSPQVELTNQQKTILDSQQVLNIQNELKPSTLAKILWLMNHLEEVLNKMLGTAEIDVQDLEFTTLRALIAQTIHKGPALFPHSEIPDLQAGSRLTLNEVIEQLETLGIKSTPRKQPLAIAHNSLLVAHTPRGDALFSDSPDISAELATVEAEMTAGKLDPKTVICALDSVGKIITPTATYPKETPHSSNENFSVRTQRMCGNLWKTWMQRLLLAEGAKIDTRFYKDGDQLILKLVTQNTPTPYVYIPTQNSKGILCKILKKNKLQIVPFHEVDFQTDQLVKEQIIMAVALGVAAGIREKIDQIILRNQVYGGEDICFYGGLIEHEQEPGGKRGWQTIFAGMMPDNTRVFHMSLPSGASAAAFIAIESIMCPAQNTWTDDPQGQSARRANDTNMIAIRESFAKQISIGLMGNSGRYNGYYDIWRLTQMKLLKKGVLDIKGLEIVEL